MIQSSKIMIVMGLSRVQKKLRIFNPQQNWIFAIKYHHRVDQFPNGTIIGPEMSFLDLNKF